MTWYSTARPGVVEAHGRDAQRRQAARQLRVRLRAISATGFSRPRADSSRRTASVSLCSTPTTVVSFTNVGTQTVLTFGGSALAPVPTSE